MDVCDKTGLTPAFVQTRVYLDMKTKVEIFPTTFFKILHSLYVAINLSRKTLPMAR